MRNASIRIWDGQKWLTGKEVQLILRSIVDLADHTLDLWMNKLPKGLQANLSLDSFKDKHDTPIFEGDIIRYFYGLETDEEGMKDESRYKTTLVEWDRDAFGFYPFNQYDDETDEWVVRRTVEILGNCYQNPELLDKAL